jgi:hypothetical protein
MHTLRAVPLTTDVALVIASLVITHLFVFSLFSTDYLLNAQNNNKTTSTNSILTRAPTTKLNTTDAFIVLFNLQRVQTAQLEPRGLE